MGIPNEHAGSLLRFNEQMLKNLDRNAHKGGWQNDCPHTLIERLEEEVAELKEAIAEDFTNVPREAADVANFAMMVADHFSQWYDD